MGPVGNWDPKKCCRALEILLTAKNAFGLRIRSKRFGKKSRVLFAPALHFSMESLLERAERCAEEVLRDDGSSMDGDAHQRMYAEAIACFLRSANAAADEITRRQIKQVFF